jgi:hypothetical protein
MISVVLLIKKKETSKFVGGLAGTKKKKIY